MAIAWRLACTIKCFAIIDIILCVLAIMITPLTVIIVFFPILGYFGSRSYHKKLIITYGIFVILNLSFRIYDYFDLTSFYRLLLCVTYLIIELFILRLIYNFIKIINLLTDEELLVLREEAWKPVNTRLTFY